MIRAMGELRRWLLCIGIEPSAMHITISFPNSVGKYRAAQKLADDCGLLNVSPIEEAHLMGLKITFESHDK